MRDRRRIDDVSTEELEKIVHRRRREERAARLRLLSHKGRRPPGLPPEVLETVRDGSTPPPRRPRWFDHLLLVLEVAAVVGFVLILAGSFGLLRSLNTEVAAALTMPTLTPTPLINVNADFLPGGHTPPTSPGGAQPIEASIPEHLRYLVTPAPPLPIPTQAPTHAVRMQIPAIGVDAPVVQGVEWEQLKKGIGQYIDSADPGQAGNGVFAAHNDVFGELFRDLDQLQPGDEITIFALTGQQFRYVVQGWKIVPPTEVSVLEPTQSPTVTLISCYPYLVDTERIVVFADLQT